MISVQTYRKSLRQKNAGFRADTELLCIDHCREGRLEHEVGKEAYSYLEVGDLRIDQRIHHTGKVSFPLCHYHGISIIFQMETAGNALSDEVRGFSVKLDHCFFVHLFTLPFD